MNEDCGCCEGTEQLTPRPIANRPGLNLLAYRVGTHAAFLETMKARLSNYFLDIPRQGVDEHGQPWADRIYPLADLTTRAAQDPSIALLDAWATVGDVLTVYQERIANEGYLRTATERRSILELARLVGYVLRPGVASTVYLAYTLDSNFKEEVVIPAGARAQSLPEGDGQCDPRLQAVTADQEPAQARGKLPGAEIRADEQGNDQEGGPQHGPLPQEGVPLPGAQDEGQLPRRHCGNGPAIRRSQDTREHGRRQASQATNPLPGTGKHRWDGRLHLGHAQRPVHHFRAWFLPLTRPQR